MAYGDFKDLTRRTASDKILRDRHFISLKMQNMMDIKEVLLQRFINSLIKKTSDSSIKNENTSNNELGKELHKAIIRKFKTRKVQSPFIDNAWGAVLLICN